MLKKPELLPEYPLLHDVRLDSIEAPKPKIAKVVIGSVAAPQVLPLVPQTKPSRFSRFQKVFLELLKFFFLPFNVLVGFGFIAVDIVAFWDKPDDLFSWYVVLPSSVVFLLSALNNLRLFYTKYTEDHPFYYFFGIFFHTVIFFVHGLELSFLKIFFCILSYLTITVISSRQYSKAHDGDVSGFWRWHQLLTKKPLEPKKKVGCVSQRLFIGLLALIFISFIIFNIVYVVHVAKAFNVDRIDRHVALPVFLLVCHLGLLFHFYNLKITLGRRICEALPGLEILGSACLLCAVFMGYKLFYPVFDSAVKKESPYSFQLVSVYFLAASVIFFVGARYERKDRKHLRQSVVVIAT